MSTTVMSKCWPLKMPPTPKAVLISLADNANDAGACWPSIATICERTCFSERTVHGAIKWLEDNGLVVADRSNGRHTRYVVCVPCDEPPQELRPRISCAPAPAAVEPPQELQSPPQIPQSPPQELRSNRKEPSIEATKKQTTPSADADLFPGVAAQVIADFKALRRAKRAPITQTAVDGIRREAEKAGLTLESALRICIDRNWQGLNAEWLKPTTTQTASRPGGGRKEL